MVACSGGPDSTALAFLAAEARPDLGLVLAHVRHGLRDDRADRALVRQHGAWLGAPVAVRDVEVVRDGNGTEAAARTVRYRALRAVADEVRAASILVGHTADDQAETVLFRSVRGSGIDGLRGMAGRNGDLTRPLLRLRRDDLRGFLQGEGLPASVDPTNEDPSVRRSLVRHEALPSLARVAPDPVGALARLADLARADVEALEELLAPLRQEVRWFGSLATIPLATLHGAPVALRRRIVRSVLEDLLGAPPPAAVVERVLHAPEPSAATLPGGVELTVGGGWCGLGSPPPVARPHTISLPGETRWEPGALLLHASVTQEGGEAPGLAGPASPLGNKAGEGCGDGHGAEQIAFPLPGLPVAPPARLDPHAVPPGGRTERTTLLLARLSSPVLRHAQPGDRVRTRVGRRTVADLLSEARMPRGLRRRWPVVVDGEEVVWVPGIAADRDVLDDGRRTPAIRLTLRHARDGAMRGR